MPADAQVIDLEWLSGEARRTLEKNRVALLQRRGTSTRTFVYHAPYRRPMEYPSNLPPIAYPLYKLWWNIKEPFQVRYPHQWTWDSCAHAITLSHLNENMAKEEIESIFEAQELNGFIPHMIWDPTRMHWLDRIARKLNHSPIGSNCLQPPILAAAIERIAPNYMDSGTSDADFVRKLLPGLKKYYSYIQKNRIRSNDGLPEIIISYESKDRSPEYDPVYGAPNTRPVVIGPMVRLLIKYRLMGWNKEKIFASNLFRVKDTLFCCIYAQSLHSMSRLCYSCGEKKEGDLYTQMAQLTETSILSKMYDDSTGLFYSLDAREEKDIQIKIKTFSCLIPLILNNISHEQTERLVYDWLYNPHEFWTSYPVPAEPLSSRPKENNIIWRGLQTWIYTNWFIEKGLRKHGYTRIADELIGKTYSLIKEQGFREYYSSLTGEGFRAEDYGWSTLVLDMVHDLDNVSP